MTIEKSEYYHSLPGFILVILILIFFFRLIDNRLNLILASLDLEDYNREVKSTFSFLVFEFVISFIFFGKYFFLFFLFSILALLIVIFLPPIVVFIMYFSIDFLNYYFDLTKGFIDNSFKKNVDKSYNFLRYYYNNLDYIKLYKIVAWVSLLYIFITVYILNILTLGFFYFFFMFFFIINAGWCYAITV